MTEGAGSAKTASAKTAEVSTVIRDQVIGAVKQGQQFALDAVQAWSDAAGKVAPKIPSLPFVPGGAEIAGSVAAAFDVAQEVLAAQRRFTSELLSVLVPASA